jgi:hypothetical protein
MGEEDYIRELRRRKREGIPLSLEEEYLAEESSCMEK